MERASTKHRHVYLRERTEKWNNWLTAIVDWLWTLVSALRALGRAVLEG